MLGKLSDNTNAHNEAKIPKIKMALIPLWLKIGPADAKPIMKDPYKVSENSALAISNCLLETSIGIDEDSVGMKNCPKVLIKKVLSKISE